MQKVKEWLKPLSDFFINSFSDTFQLLLTNFLGDYLEDPKQLNMITLVKGVEMLKLNKGFINQLLGQSLFKLEEAYIESIKVANLKFEAKGLKLVFVISQEINVEELKAFIEKTEQAKEKEIQKLTQLNQLREEVYKQCELEASCDFQKSTNPQTGLIQFLSLVDTLLSNSSLTIKDIEVILRAENQKEYKLHIHQTNIDFQKPDMNNLLFINFGINLIELQSSNEKIMQINEALRLEMVLETKNNRVTTKIDGKMSNLDIVMNKNQIQGLLKTVQNYMDLTNQLNKTILEIKDTPLIEFDDDDDITEVQSFRSIQTAKESVILNNSFKRNKLVLNLQHFDHMNENLQQSLQKSLANHPIPKQQEQQFIEYQFSQSLFSSSFDSSPLTSYQKSVQNQTEQFKFLFEGIRVAVCETNSEFPKLKGRFFQELDSHFFIEIIKLSTAFQKDILTFKIQSIGAHNVKAGNNISNVMQSQEIFKSCLDNPKLEFFVTPVLMMGLTEVGKIELDYATYLFDKLQEECTAKKLAVDIQIQTYKRRREKFYQINGQLSDIIASLNHELLLSLFSYLPQNEVQQLPQEEDQKQCMFGFDIKFPYINVNYVIMNKPIKTTLKEIRLKQSPVQPFIHKYGTIQSFEGQPQDENPLQFMFISFYSIWIEYQGQVILEIGQNVCQDKQIFPLLYISFQKKTEQQIQKNADIKEIMNIQKLKSEMLIRGSIPTIKLNLTQDFIFFILQLQQQFQIENSNQNLQQNKIQQKKSQMYFQLSFDELQLIIKDQIKDLFIIELRRTSIISSKSQLFLINNITIIDVQAQMPLYNNKKIEQYYFGHPSYQVILYRSHFIPSQSQIISALNSNKKYLKTFEIDYDSYMIKAHISKKISIMIQNICVRIPDFTFTSIKKLNPILEYYNKIKDQTAQKLLNSKQLIEQEQEENDEKKQLLQITLKHNIYLDIFPINQTEELTEQGLKLMKRISNSRSIFKIDELNIIDQNINLQTLEIFVCRQNGYEFQCPLILEEYFDKLHAFQFVETIKVIELKVIDNNEIKIDQINAIMKYDVLQTILEIIEEIQPYLPRNQAIPATKELYMINKDLMRPLINNQQLQQEYSISIGVIKLVLEEGHTFYQMPLFFQSEQNCTTFEEELKDFACSCDILPKKDLDKIIIELYTIQLLIEQYDQGQLGIIFKSNIEIIDEIQNSKFKLILSPDPEPENEKSLNIGLIIENETYTSTISIAPLRICISGAFLQFLINFYKSSTWIPKQVNEDQIEICQQQQKNHLWLKNLQIMPTSINVTYDSQGLKFDDIVKGLLKLSSFYNLEFPISFIHASVEGTLEQVIENVLSQFKEGLGSKIGIAGKAIQSMEAFSIVTNLIGGMVSLIIAPFQDGLIEGTKKGVTEFSNSFAFALLKVIKMPTSAIVAGGESVGLHQMTKPFKYVKEKSSIMLNRITPNSLPKRFIKKI